MVVLISHVRKLRPREVVRAQDTAWERAWGGLIHSLIPPLCHIATPRMVNNLSHAKSGDFGPPSFTCLSHRVLAGGRRFPLLRIYS